MLFSSIPFLYYFSSSGPGSLFCHSSPVPQWSAAVLQLVFLCLGRAEVCFADGGLHSVRLRLRAFAGTVSGWAGREIYLRNFGGNQSLFSLVF